MNLDERHCDPDELALAALGEPTSIEAEHLAHCEDCQAEIASLRRVVRTARSTDDPELSTPSGSVWQAITNAMSIPADTSTADTVAVVIPMQRRSRAPWIGLAAAIGLVLGGIGGAVVVQNSSTPATVIAQASLEPLPGFTTRGNAEIRSSDSGNSVSVDLIGLPETQGYYEVWLLTDDASVMVSLGTVGPGETSTLPLPPGIALDRFRVVDVSAEEFDGDPTHSAVSVVRGTLDA
jgi:hypothetical protein